MSHIRPQVEELILRLSEPRQFIQVISGARQVGKTTMAIQAAERSGLPHRYATADGPTLQASAWIEQQWQAGRILAHESDELGALLILDEIQKAPQWAESIKRLWDEDAMNDVNLKVVTLSSTPLLTAPFAAGLWMDVLGERQACLTRKGDHGRHNHPDHVRRMRRLSSR